MNFEKRLDTLLNHTTMLTDHVEALAKSLLVIQENMRTCEAKTNKLAKQLSESVEKTTTQIAVMERTLQSLNNSALPNVQPTAQSNPNHHKAGNNPPASPASPATPKKRRP